MRQRHGAGPALPRNAARPPRRDDEPCIVGLAVAPDSSYDYASAILETIDYLAGVEPAKAEEFSGEIDPWRIHAELKQLVAKRARWDDVFGHVAMLFKQSRAWSPLGFANFGRKVAGLR